MSAQVEIAYIAGNCPVQAEGTIDGKPFYFRARGDEWSLGIGGEPVGQPEWSYEEPFGEWPDAGWMTVEQAEGFIRAAAERYEREREADGGAAAVSPVATATLVCNVIPQFPASDAT